MTFSRSLRSLRIPTLRETEEALLRTARTAAGGAIRLAVTGLSGSGKTVFTTAVVHDLLKASPTRLPFFSVVKEGRLVAARLEARPDSHLPDFRYDRHVAALTAEEPDWPESTTGLSRVRVALRYRPNSFWRRGLTDAATLTVDIVDYPGEWLLDLPLLDLSYDAWSERVLARCRTEPRRSLARDWLGAATAADASGPFSEEEGRRLAELYTAFLLACREPHRGLSVMQPGRFTQPGDLRDAPLLRFSPLPAVSGRPGRGSLRQTFAERYEAYKEHVVRPFYRDHFARFDRQVVLVDLFRALNAGPHGFADTQAALADILKSFRYGQGGPLARLFRPRIDRVLFAAAKADHVAANQHGNLRHLLDRMIGEASASIRFEGAEVRTVALAAVKATETVIAEHGGQKLSCVRGVPAGRENATVLFPGEVPADLPRDADWSAERFRFLDFRPPILADRGHGPFPHIGLDQALESLLGDRFS